MKIQINITGNAYFEVKRQDGETVYTLSRQFHPDETGQIVTAEGYELLEVDPMPVPFNETLAISETGEVSIMQGGIWTVLGQIMAVKFQNAAGLEDLGDGYYNKSQGSGDPQVGVPGSGIWANVKVYYIPEAGKQSRQIAVLNINKLRKINDFMAKMRGISLNMSLHTALFPSPMPSLLTFNANIDALEDAEAVTKTRVRGSVEARNQAYDLVLDNVHNLLNYVQSLADNADDAADAKEIIICSGFDLKTKGSHTKDELEVRNGAVSGQIFLIAKAVYKAGAYEWQMSIDNQTWIQLPSTIKAKTKVNELIPATTVYFRCRAITISGEGNWTQAVPIMVI